MRNRELPLEKFRERLAHLKAMPQTPTRRLEIIALERTLEEASKRPTPSVRSPRGPRTRGSIDLEDDTPRGPAKPLREVVRENGKRKVIIRRAPKVPDDDEETALDVREREERRASIRSLLDGSHRGMS